MKVTEKLSSIENEHFIISLRLIIKMKNMKPNIANCFYVSLMLSNLVKSCTKDIIDTKNCLFIPTYHRMIMNSY